MRKKLEKYNQPWSFSYRTGYVYISMPSQQFVQGRNLEIDFNLFGIYFQGCYTELKDFVKDKIVVIGGIGLGFAFIQVS